MASSKDARQLADAIRAEGNVAFKKGKYGAAIDSYTEAICVAPDMHVLYVNRALCYKKRSEWDKAESDARKALGLHSGLMKGNYCLGIALRHKRQYQESAVCLGRALEAAREAGDSIKDEIWRELAACKHAQWEQHAHVARTKRSRLKERLQLMMDEYCKRHCKDTACEQDRADLRELFANAELADAERETHTAYTCTLTMEPFREPVITPDGHSYERAALEEHLKKVGKFDPISRTPLDETQLVPNFRLRAATMQYLDEHPWTWGECTNPSF